MKKKFLILTLCFTLVFTSINYKESYADGGIISLPILATVSSLAVASGIVIKNNDDIYDIGKSFYNYVKQKNEMTWDVLTATFNASVTVLNNKLISVDSKFLDIVKSFFDDTFSKNVDVNGYVEGFPALPAFNGKYFYSYKSVNKNNENYGKYFLYAYNSLGSAFSDNYTVTSSDYSYYQNANLNWVNGSTKPNSSVKLYKSHFNTLYDSIYTNDPTLTKTLVSWGIPVSSPYEYSIPYEGGYTWDNVENKKEDDKSVALPIPGDLGTLVGQGSADFWDNTDNLVGTGGISIPNVDDPSISVDDTIVSFPSVDVPSDTPADTPFANITDYIIGLVVPGDSYWTDTFGGLRNNFISSFPMVDMGSFNSLAVNGKPFPNIDIKIMGSKGRVVNGDTVNSIVDWLRPIISGFIFLCLMFFNYRKLYKLIRNSEPFEGIGKVENHAN